jgi:hypothetical protein
MQMGETVDRSAGLVPGFTVVMGAFGYSGKYITRRLLDAAGGFAP